MGKKFPIKEQTPAQKRDGHVVSVLNTLNAHWCTLIEKRAVLNREIAALEAAIEYLEQ
jgi:uncharacterized protein YdcH (DUF465 family)